MYEIKSGRIKPKSKPTFGKKKSGKKSNSKKSDLFGHSRLKSKPSMKNKKKDIYLNPDKPVRFSKSQMLDINLWIINNIPCCQVCNESTNLDVPHHAIYGLGNKDDRCLVSICIVCHREIHSGSYDNLKKTREEIIEIGWNNFSMLKEVFDL